MELFICLVCALAVLATGLSVYFAFSDHCALANLIKEARLKIGELKIKEIEYDGK